jgi:hypoxanthine phosphoribosyltransferase
MSKPETPKGKITETWESIEQKSVMLAGQIAARCERERFKFRRTVILPRGAWGMANIVTRRLGAESTQIFSDTKTHYLNGQTLPADKMKSGQEPDYSEFAGVNTLVLDEVCQTGESLAVIKNSLVAAGAGRVIVAVLAYKQGQSTTGLVPDHYVYRTEDWIEFPWEIHDQAGEMSRTFEHDMRAEAAA